MTATTKKCSCCKKEVVWVEQAFVAYTDDCGMKLAEGEKPGGELRNCKCGSTLMVIY